jgi:cytochrome o ubiquinol oxidase subunit IV
MDQSHEHNNGTGHSTVKGYVTGFILAIVLTVISFGLIMLKDKISEMALYAGLFGAAIVQMLVHLHYFLHLDRSTEQRWNVIAIGFTAILLFIFIGGTMWVMYTLNSRMM